MGTSEPIRNKRDVKRISEYYINIKPNERNAVLIIMGLNTALRISDLLKLKWKDVWNSTLHKPVDRLELNEQKTGKFQNIPLNSKVRDSLKAYRKLLKTEHKGETGFFNELKDYYLFYGRTLEKPMSRSEAYRVVKTAAREIGLSDNISCHSLRKTFGYFAWKKGIPPAVIMDIYNHSSYEITRRYLGIVQDDKDKVFLLNKL